MKTVFKTEVVMTFLGSDGFLIATFLGSDGSKDPNSLSVLPRLHDQPQRDHLCSALQVNFFSSDYQQLCDCVLLDPVVHWPMLNFVILLFQMIMIISVVL